MRPRRFPDRVLLLAILAVVWLDAPTLAADPPPPLALGTKDRDGDSLGRIPRAPRRPATDQTGSSGGWWLGTAGVALALAAFGAISVASRQQRRGGPEQGTLRVVGRAPLSSKHAVSLVQIGDRILIVGTGAQGPPALLGELDDPAEVRQFIRPAAPPAPRREVRA